ncbi:PCI domain-containing protein [Pseudocercospora fuligena]|uniref:PCI domain-containing protein n=1 Tax=Pseudocercospora fuligena TaxID=685502 RepID=A0A8H6RH07_9PEZI|nr:PCI domain-containing protein [Pseudocercospora fuligena]
MPRAKRGRSRQRESRESDDSAPDPNPNSVSSRSISRNNTTNTSLFDPFTRQKHQARVESQEEIAYALGIFDWEWVDDYVQTCSKNFNLGLDLEEIWEFTNDAIDRFEDFKEEQVTPELLKRIQEWFASRVALSGGDRNSSQDQKTSDHEQDSSPETDSAPHIEDQNQARPPLKIEHSTKRTEMALSVGGTPVLGQFLTAINGFIQVQNARELASYIAIEPPFGKLYYELIAELKQNYPKDKEEALEEKCRQMLVTAREGVDGSATWTPFILFMVQYLSYLRDVNEDTSALLETYDLLIGLQERANSALSHGTLGVLMLPVVVRCAQVVCRLAIGLDRRPELMAQLRSAGAAASGGDDEGGARETLPERAAEILRRAFTACMNDKTTAANKVEGKKQGIYKIANICLKILFQCRKTRNAAMIFENIGNQSPQLSQYPKSERVTYLYYLGRYLFQNNHFYRAQEALQYAYDECSAGENFIRQRRHILVYLVSSNIILGRFPSAALLQRPEAAGFQEHFAPIMQAMRTGNLALFRQALDFNGPHADWFLHFRVLLPLRNRCEVHVWRTLVRRVWKTVGARYIAGTKTAPLVDMNILVNAFKLAENSATPTYIDPDFAGGDYEPTDGGGYEIINIESILSSLIDQGLVKGFIVHSSLKFVLSGTKQSTEDQVVLAAAFPQPWSVIASKANRASGEVPGWRKRPQAGPGGGGRVVNMSNLATVGAS